MDLDFQNWEQNNLFSLHKDHKLHDRSLTSTEIRAKPGKEVCLVFQPSGLSRGPIAAPVPLKNPD